MLFAMLAIAAQTQAVPAVALYYGKQIALNEFRTFDIVVVEPDHGHDPKRYAKADSQLYAYVSVAEVQASRAYYPAIPAAWKMARNGDWNSEVIDQTPAEWPEFFAEKVVGPLWARGYRGFFLDTLDSYRLAKTFDETAQQAGLVRVIETLHRRFPGIQLILNRGFEIVPQVRDKIRMVAAESLFQGWNATTRRYEPVKPADREWLLGQLNTIKQRDGVDILAIDYVAPHDRKRARATAEKIKKLGFIPWVTDSQLDSIGIGAIENQPRRILILYNGLEVPALNYTLAHRFLQMPLNHLGYIVDYADVRQPLPNAVWGDRYAGIVTWFSGQLPENLSRPVAQWLFSRIDEGMRLAMLGNFGFPLDHATAGKLGLRLLPDAAAASLSVSQQHPMLGFEAPPRPNRSNLSPIRLTDSTSQALIELRDSHQQTYSGGALTNWGGFILDPYTLIEIPGTEQARWVIDPFAFLNASLQLPPMPVPDVTTENGRRLFFSHIDGDGFPSLSESPGSPPAGAVLLKEILEKYQVPTTMSVIEAEISPQGLHPKMSRQLEDIARRMFRLSHVEIASHTYTHPFRWDNSVRHGIFQEDKEAVFHLDVPGYEFDLTREIVGAMDYIRQRLAPPNKPVNLLLWSGDTAPGADALEIAEKAGYLNMNGGDTSITRSNPSLTAVGANGIEKNGYLQIYAPITNENIYTNLWHGPFYGFERVIETFAMTESPRRLKPVDIYFHSYSASKPAGVKALHKVFGWAETQPLHPVFASEYIRKVQDFYTMAIARDGDGWRIRGDGRLRTLRLPAGLRPDLATAQGIAGFNANQEGYYLHLADSAAWFAAVSPAATPVAAPSQPYLFDANARLSNWQSNISQGKLNISFRLTAHQPLDFRLANLATCQLSVNDRPASPGQRATLDSTSLTHFQLTNAAATIAISCPAR